MPDKIRGSRSTRHRLRAQGKGIFLAAICVFAPVSAGAAEQPMQQPMQALRALVLTAQSSIDQHQIASITVVCGVVLFAVVSAIMLVRSWARAARLERRLHKEIAALRDEVDRANALMRSEPQVVVVWPAGADEPKIDGDPAPSASRCRIRCSPSALGSTPPKPAPWNAPSTPCAAAARRFRCR